MKRFQKLLGFGAIAGGLCLAIGQPVFAQVDATEQQPPDETAIPDVWQPASPEEIEQIWAYILHSPMGIAALNQLAIEGFISPTCERAIYTHAEYGSFQTLMQIECPGHQGISIARAYDEVRVTFNRFEDIIEDFDIERVYVGEQYSQKREDNSNQ